MQLGFYSSKSLCGLLELLSSGTAGLQRKVEALATAAKLRQAGPGFTRDMPGLQDSSLSEIFGVLSQQAKGIATLQSVLQREARDLAILDKSAVQA